MSRRRTSRLRVTGCLVATAPIHAGGLRVSELTDMPLATDGQGRTYVPGTALAGAWRAWMADRMPSDVVTALWGPLHNGGDEGRASHVVVDDAQLVGPDQQETWDHVGIDREYGGGAVGIKYDRAVLPAGTTIAFSFAVDLPVGGAGTEASMMDAHARAAIGHLLAAFQRGDVPVGAAQTRGLGAVHLDPGTLRIIEEDWSSPGGLIATLQGASPTRTCDDLMSRDAALSPEQRLACDEPARLLLDLVWNPVGPVMVQASAGGLDVDALPFVTGLDAQHVALAIPGSSIKGALRARAECVVRTALRRCAAWPAEGRQRHLAQVNEPLVATVFGAARVGDPQDDQASTAARGLLSCGTCTARDLPMDRERWAAVAQQAGGPVDEGDGTTRADGEPPLYQALRGLGLRGRVGGARVEQAFHVAIDRWTGGAAEHLLFSGLEPFGVKWPAIQLALDLERLPSTLRRPAVALVLLLVREFGQNRVPIGFGANRGYGAVQLESVHCRVRGREREAAQPFASLDDVRIDPTLAGVPDSLREEITTAWRHWLDEQAAPAGEEVVVS